VYRGLVGKPEGRRPLERSRRRWVEIIFRWIFRKWYVGVRTGLGWLRTETGGEQLWMRYWTFRLNKTRGISWLATNRLVTQEGLCSMELVSESVKILLDKYRLKYINFISNQWMGFWFSLKYSNFSYTSSLYLKLFGSLLWILR
jgi:hypothetical protein